MTTIISEFTKDPQAKLDYLFDWKPKTNQSLTDPDISDYLQSTEIISTFEISASALGSGSVVTLSGSSLTNTNTSVLVWISGGELYKDNWVTCKINTSLSRIDERTITVKIRNK